MKETIIIHFIIHLEVTNFSQVYSVAHTGTGCALYGWFSHGIDTIVCPSRVRERKHGRKGIHFMKNGNNKCHVILMGMNVRVHYHMPV